MSYLTGGSLWLLRRQTSTLVDGSAVNVDISSNKIAVQHAKLASNDHGERWRVFWRTRLEEVKIGG